MDKLFNYLHLIATGVLIGKVVLLSFVVAPIIARTLDAESFGKIVRRLFPAYDLLGLVSAAVALLSLMGLASLEGSPMIVLAMALWMGVLASEWYSRSFVTPRSNAMRDRLKEQELHGLVDSGLREAWERLHRRSVSLNSAVLIAGLILVGAAGHPKPIREATD
ncbi:MAG TPA: DUF4149 domain-containing protein [Nitrospira sp.]|nr:DUF4149 domain-containing protein [Nitrospira sp.]